MKNISRILIAIAILAFPASAQITAIGGKVVVGGKTLLGSTGASAFNPTLNQFFGKNGLDKNRGGATTGINGNLLTLDPSGYPRAVTAGSFNIVSGTWPDAPNTGNGDPATCASHCVPTFVDNNSTTLTAAFTAGTCQDSNGNNHGIFYEANVTANSNQITETHPAKITSTYFNISNWYSMATSSVLDGTPTCATVTPANNTAPNISGTAITLSGINSLVYIEVDQTNMAGNNQGTANWTSVTIPANCTLLDESIYQGHLEMACIPPSTGSFTPQVTIAQATHATFVIYAAAFKAGAGGSAPAAGNAILLANTNQYGAVIGTYTQNVPCPTTTTTLAIADDAGSITAVADSNSDTFSSASAAGGIIRTYYKTGIVISNSNTFTVTVTIPTNANVDLVSFYCMNTSALDTGFTAGTGNTQVTTSTILHVQTQGTGGGNCQGTAGTAVTCTDLPTGTPGSSGDVFIITGNDGQGPVLEPTQPSGVVQDFPSPTAINACSSAAAGICGGDANDYTNGDVGGHYWVNSTAQINFGWLMAQNGAQTTVMITAFH